MTRIPMTGAIMQREPCSTTAKRDGGATRQLRRPDRNVLSEAIAVFFIGRDSDGFWVARDADRPIGGLFLLRSSALAFARNICEPHGCAFVFETDRFELDVENRGNRFAVRIGRFKRVLKNIGRRGTFWLGARHRRSRRILDRHHLLGRLDELPNRASMGFVLPVDVSTTIGTPRRSMGAAQWHERTTRR